MKWNLMPFPPLTGVLVACICHCSFGSDWLNEKVCWEKPDLKHALMLEHVEAKWTHSVSSENTPYMPGVFAESLYVVFFNYQNKPMRRVLLSTTFYNWGKSSTKMVSNVPTSVRNQDSGFQALGHIGITWRTH